jgi:hypothetical protein
MIYHLIMAETCYDLNTAINKYTVLKQKINKFNIYWKNNALIIIEIRNDNKQQQSNYNIWIKIQVLNFLKRSMFQALKH